MYILGLKNWEIKGKTNTKWCMISNLRHVYEDVLIIKKPGQQITLGVYDWKEM